MDFETKCVHGGCTSSADQYKALSYPIYQTASFAHAGFGSSTGFDYTRESNPTRERLEHTVASLEEAAGAVAFSSGMAAISTVMELFRPGDHLIIEQDLYGGSIRLFHTICEKNGLTFTYASFSSDDIESMIRPNTKALYVETPTNPMMKVVDIRRLADIAHRHGLLLIIDNTFLSPYFQKPLTLGADIVVHSGTKYLGGHNDTIAGFAAASSLEIVEHLHETAMSIGSVLAPFDSWLILRGIQTLAIRLERAEKNAMQIALWLKEQPCIKNVYYPGLPEHPGYAIMKKQASGFGAMVSFRTDSRETAIHILNHVKLISFAESLGGTESLITYPLTQTHADVPEDMRRKSGIDDTLLRLSVGIESAENLIDDLASALPLSKI